MLPEFASLLETPTFKAFGIALAPLSLGHVFLLESIQSPLITNTAKAEISDLLLLVLVCSRPYQEASKTLKDPELATRIESMAQTWAKTLSKTTTIEEQAKTIEAYLLHYLQAPPRWGGSGSRLKTPWQLYLITQLQKELGITEQEAWSMPCNKAFGYYAAIAEGYGDKELMTDEEAKRVSEINNE